MGFPRAVSPTCDRRIGPVRVTARYKVPRLELKLVDADAKQVRPRCHRFVRAASSPQRPRRWVPTEAEAASNRADEMLQMFLRVALVDARHVFRREPVASATIWEMNLFRGPCPCVWVHRKTVTFPRGSIFDGRRFHRAGIWVDSPAPRRTSGSRRDRQLPHVRTDGSTPVEIPMPT